VSILVEDDLGQLLVDIEIVVPQLPIGSRGQPVQDSVDSPDGPCGAEAAAGANRRRNTGGSDPLRVDPTGRAAPDGPPTSLR